MTLSVALTAAFIFACFYASLAGAELLIMVTR